MTSEIIYEGDLRCQAQHLASKSTIVTDAPLDNQGRGAAFSPTDLLATALGACMLTIMGIKARDMGVSLMGAQAACLKTMAANPRRVQGIDLDIHLPAEVTTADRKILEAVGLACPVAKSLHPDLAQNVTFHWDQL